MARAEAGDVFLRNPGNPILAAGDLPYAANAVFNAGAARVGDETLLLARVEDRRGLSHLTAARSADGVGGWRVDPAPTLPASPETHPEEIWGIEDPRITRLEEEGVWAIVYTAYSRDGPLVSLATTRDFRSFERLGPVLPPENKDAALFPVRFDGRWALLHRPVPSTPAFGAHVWISFSPDLRHWGEPQVLLRAREGGWWDAGKIGLSPPPLLTERGWLVLYHGVRRTASGCLYRLGLALLDLADPRRVIRRSSEYVFSPREIYERVGDVPAAVFPCGWVLDGDEVRLYYGAADTTLALATASLGDLFARLDRDGG